MYTEKIKLIITPTDVNVLRLFSSKKSDESSKEETSAMNIMVAINTSSLEIITNTINAIIIATNFLRNLFIGQFYT